MNFRAGADHTQVAKQTPTKQQQLCKDKSIEIFSSFFRYMQNSAPSFRYTKSSPQEQTCDFLMVHVLCWGSNNKHKWGTFKLLVSTSLTHYTGSSSDSLRMFLMQLKPKYCLPNKP
jgi:hypothetical protein